MSCTKILFIKMSNDECTECKESLEVIETEDGSSVCSNCGIVIGNFNLVAAFQSEGIKKVDKESNNFIRLGNQLLYAGERKKLYRDEILTKYRTYLQAVLQNYTEDHTVHDSIMKIFEPLVFSELHGKQEKTKRQYLVCCTTVVLQKKNIPVILSKVAEAMDVKVKGLQGIVTKVKKKYEMTKMRVTLKQTISRIAHKVNAIRNSELHSKKIDGLIELLDVCQYLDGKDREIAAIHVAYMACLSSIGTIPSNYTFMQFCKENNLKETRGYLKEMIDRLLLAMKLLKLEAEVSYTNYHIYLGHLVKMTPIVRRRIHSHDNDDHVVPVQLHSNPIKVLRGDHQMTLRVARRILTTPSCFAKNSERDRKRRAKGPLVFRKSPKVTRIAPDTEELDDDDLMGEPLSEFLKKSIEVGDSPQL